MKKITIYSSMTCNYCFAAKNFFRKKKLDFSEIVIDGDENLKKKLIKITNGKTTVPQIFFDEVLVGGYDQLMELNEKNLIMKMLND